VPRGRLPRTTVTLFYHRKLPMAGSFEASRSGDRVPGHVRQQYSKFSARIKAVMFKLLIDTCVWLDIAKDTRQAPLLDVMDEMIRQRLISVLVPDLLLTEFRRNRARIAADSAKSMSSHFRLVKDAIGRIGGDEKRVKSVLSHLDDVSHKIPLVGGAAGAALDRIEKTLAAGSPVPMNHGIRLRAAQRAIDKRAPFHRDKNSMADAMLIETYADCVGAKGAVGSRFAFVTHNKADFSTPNGNQKLPHPDIASYFSRIKSLYFINLVEALRRVAPGLVSDLMLEHSWTQDPRGLTDLLEAEERLSSQVWYDRHMMRLHSIEEGSIKLVERRSGEQGKYDPGTIYRDIWDGALKAAERVRKRYGKDNFGPWSDFEWGMINGKLSAIRWVLGDEWDMLDT
jgi:hypothetical protein